MNEKSDNRENLEKQPYVTPETKQHDPLSIVRGSGSDGSSLYYTSLYHECSLYYYY